ncbi:hypothetical protein M2390_000081 [Mycetocola sp. BIGb0189]|uniref:hypothetical protein n=1 Tax=Mycetocola sp. BIGb0189 TaxID=2940604 RepID=UPI002169C3AE|nr:hypothetical protein [Mycetocola sp. BIGb0189]MCS4274923.1 hypothetical protein [Mycetocola sp. BIGb0189]
MNFRSRALTLALAATTALTITPLLTAAVVPPTSLTATDDSRAIVTLTITDDVTGQIVYSQTTNPELSETGTIQISAKPNVSTSAGFAKPYLGAGNSQTGSITSTINVVYSNRAQDDAVRLEQVNGSWTGTSGYELFDRVVNYTTNSDQVGRKEPLNNSFNYTTGWDWVPFPPALPQLGSGARAGSTVSYRIPGTGSGSLSQTVLVEIPRKK